MGHADTLTRDQVAAVDDMAALSGTIRDAVAARSYRSAQRAYDDRTDERLDALYAGEERRLIAEGEAKARASHAMEVALCSGINVLAMKGVEGSHSPATLVSTLLGADDAVISGLALAALRAACAVDHGRPRDMCDAEAGAALRRLADVLCQRFAEENWNAYMARDGVTL